MNISKQESYLMGLMCGRGHIFNKEKRIIIEFAHKNRFVYGIATCPKCGNLATEKKEDNEDKNLICKTCGTIVSKDSKKEYEQRDSTINSINNSVMPFLLKKFKIDYDIIGNDHMTFLVLEFKNDLESYRKITSLFNGKINFDSFEIPNTIYSSPKEYKIEFVNGLLDTAGFFNRGGWLPRDGENGTGRMRAYFQIVRNWKMPVLICNFLKKELSLPIHTIDWGHPNIRDSNLEDYYNTNPLSWGREHQIKFFPEYYNAFKIRLKHKQDMFNELKNYNLKVKFYNSDDCQPPSPIRINQIKAFHPGEKDIRLPLEIKGHFDSYWQVCCKLGCIYCKNKLNKSKNKNILFITGKDEKLDEKKIFNELNKKRRVLTKNIIKANYGKTKGAQKKIIINQRTNPEQQLYAPITIYFEGYLKRLLKTEVKAHDTSPVNLDNFIIRNGLFDDFDFCNQFKIRPDIVGFILKSHELGFIEVKIGELTIQDIGQLLGYCLVANPKIAILISPKEPSMNLIKILKAHPYLLSYHHDKKILIATWKDNKFKFFDLK
ncbi:MAG: hypothetical protein KKF50_03530 [Nanoarchaeota archaeon]|nr:hypothetical protein [Nanoarchaeota archaeon]